MKSIPILALSIGKHLAVIVPPNLTPPSTTAVYSVDGYGSWKCDSHALLTLAKILPPPLNFGRPSHSASAPRSRHGFVGIYVDSPDVEALQRGRIGL